MTSTIAIDLKFFVPIKFSTSERTIHIRSSHKKYSQKKVILLCFLKCAIFCPSDTRAMVNNRAPIMMLFSGEKNASTLSSFAPLQIGHMDSECDLQCVVQGPNALLGWKVIKNKNSCSIISVVEKLELTSGSGLMVILFVVVIILLLVGLQRQNRILKTLHEQGQNNAPVLVNIGQENKRLTKKINEIDRTVRQLKAKQETEMAVNQPKMNIFDPRYCTTVPGKKINNNIRRRSGIPRSTTFPRSNQNDDLEDDDFRSEFNIPFPRDAPDA